MEFVFPAGLLGLRVEAVTDFDKRGQGDDQARDKNTGERLWQVVAVDLDPEAGKFGRPTEVKVKIAAPVQPVLPESAMPGYPPAIEFTDLVLTPYVDSQRCKGAGSGAHRCRARLAYSIRAGAVIAPQGVARGRKGAA
nr:hypothetical protein [Asanoa siamensis]